MYRAITALVLVGLAVLAPVVGATAATAGGPSEPQTALSADASVAQATNTSENTTMWTNEMTIAEDFDESEQVAMSDADANGTLHVAYTQDDTIRYAKVDTRGTVESDTELKTVTTGLGDIAIAATPDGRAHVVYEAGVQNDEIRRIAIDDNGTTDFEQTFLDGSEVELEETLETGPRGRVFALVNNENFGTDTSAELWILNGKDTTTNSREFSSEFHGGSLTVRNETLYAAYISTNEYQYYDDFPLRLRSWDVGSSSIEQADDQQLNEDVFSGQRVMSVGVAASGYVFVGYGSGVDVYELDTQELIGTGTNTEGNNSIVVDRDDVPYVFEHSRYHTYDPGTLQQDATAASPGANASALNRDGFPSVVYKTEDDTLVYRGLVVRGLENYTNLYDRFETINAALIDKSRDVNISVTVAPASEAGFVNGSEARVQVGTDRVDPTAVSLEYQGETYAPDANGVATIPLEETGSHELAVVYQNVRESVSIQVVAAGQASATTTAGATGTGEGTASGTSTASGPGFGVSVAVLAVVALSLLAGLRRRRSR